MGQIHFVLHYLKDFNMTSILLRLFLSVVVGGSSDSSGVVTEAPPVSGRTFWYAWAPP